MVSIAGINIAIRCEDRSFFQLIDHRYRSFRTDGKTSFKLHTHPEPGMPEIHAPLVVKGEGVDSYILKGAIEGVISVKAKVGQVFLPPDPVAFDGLLRLIAGTLLLKGGGMLLHASGVVRRSLAWVFFGPSEAGKTTITELCRGDPVLSDEVVAVRKNDGGTYYAHSTPFRGKWKPGKPVPPAPLGALLSPRKSRRTDFERIAAPNAVKLLVPQVIMHPEIGKSSQWALGNCCDLLDSIPCFTLNFLLNTPIKETLDEIASSHIPLSSCGVARG
ncbi:MAG: hypothetical protein AB1742_14825 [bacterium]